MSRRARSRIEAALDGLAEIGFTILSMTVSLAAVFIPVVFMGGIVGRLLHEFAVTIVLAIVVSGIVSVTLTPMLCSRFLKPGKSAEHGRFYQASEHAFDRVQSRYERTLRWSVDHRRSFLAFSSPAWPRPSCCSCSCQTDFLPSDDTGQIIGSTEAADRTSFDQMVAYQQQAAAIAHEGSQCRRRHVGGGRRRLALRHQHRHACC